MGGAKQGSFFFDPTGGYMSTVYPGSEPYSIDYGCAYEGTRRPNETPGKRWADTPSWTAVAVATPCPCAYGTFSKFHGPKTSKIPPTPDSVLVNPSLGGLSGQ